MWCYKENITELITSPSFELDYFDSLIHDMSHSDQKLELLHKESLLVGSKFLKKK
jgi:hypothetical protein